MALESFSKYGNLGYQITRNRGIYSMIKRILKLDDFLSDTNILFLGPRQTGKSTLLKSEFKDNAHFINLLESDSYLLLSKMPSLIRDMVNESSKKIIVIDEIQKIPELLDEVHLLIEKNKKLKFILTGSSARKLRKKGINLLGGRAYPIYFHPLTSAELVKTELTFNEYLIWGGIPSILLSKQKKLKMQAYIHLYLKEEILEEGLVRNVGPFSRFLDVAATVNTEQIDFSSIASDSQISTKTITNYFEILQDTLIGYLLPSFRETKTRKAVSKPKFYFFDVGVANYLIGRDSLKEKTPEFGKVLEHFIFTELRSYIDYNLIDAELFYWRSQSQMEVDFIIKLKNKKLIGIEVKGSEVIKESHLRGLNAFEEDFSLEHKIIVSNEKHVRTIGKNTKAYPFKIFCEKLWNKEFFK
jgi:predicted AAA+ superfamily ATPase